MEAVKISSETIQGTAVRAPLRVKQIGVIESFSKYKSMYECSIEMDDGTKINAQCPTKESLRRAIKHLSELLETDTW